MCCGYCLDVKDPLGRVDAIGRGRPVVVVAWRPIQALGTRVVSEVDCRRDVRWWVWVWGAWCWRGCAGPLASRRGPCAGDVGIGIALVVPPFGRETVVPQLLPTRLARVHTGLGAIRAGAAFVRGGNTGLTPLAAMGWARDTELSAG